MFDGSSCGNADGHHGPPEAAGKADQCAHSASLSLRWDDCTRVPHCIYLFGSSFLRHMPPEAPRTPEQSQSSRPEPCRDPELAQADQSQQAHAEQQAPAQPAPRRRSKSRKRDLVEVDRLVVSARRVLKRGTHILEDQLKFQREQELREIWLHHRIANLELIIEELTAPTSPAPDRSLQEGELRPGRVPQQVSFAQQASRVAKPKTPVRPGPHA